MKQLFILVLALLFIEVKAQCNKKVVVSGSDTITTVLSTNLISSANPNFLATLGFMRIGDRELFCCVIDGNPAQEYGQIILNFKNGETQTYRTLEFSPQEGKNLVVCAMLLEPTTKYYIKKQTLLSVTLTRNNKSIKYHVSDELDSWFPSAIRCFNEK